MEIGWSEIIAASVGISVAGATWLPRLFRRRVVYKHVSMSPGRRAALEQASAILEARDHSLRHHHNFNRKVEGIPTCECGDRYLDMVN